MSNKLAYTYEIYIGVPVDRVWAGLIDGDITKKYVYGTRFDGKLKKGAPYAYVGDGDFKVVDGEILEVEPGKRLVMTWKAHWDDSVAKDPPSSVTYGRVRDQASPCARRFRPANGDLYRLDRRVAPDAVLPQKHP